ncbi:MAG TPA: hypothetical protein VI316_08240 [Candidatus Dormibacteraeota bacterium]
MPDQQAESNLPRAHGSLRLHQMPDRRAVGRYDRLRQKWWAMRAQLRLRLGRRRV